MRRRACVQLLRAASCHPPPPTLNLTPTFVPTAVPSVALSAVGLTLWTRWENEYDAETAYTVLTPKRANALAGAGIDDDDEQDDDDGFEAGFQRASPAALSGAAKQAAVSVGVRGTLGASHRGTAMVAPAARARPQGVELSAIGTGKATATGVRSTAGGDGDGGIDGGSVGGASATFAPVAVAGSVVSAGERTGLLAKPGGVMRKTWSDKSFGDSSLEGSPR